MNARTRSLNRLLDVARSEAVMGRMHRATGKAAALAGRLRGQARALVEGAGMAGRVDLADATAELAALTDATDRLTDTVARLEATVDRWQTGAPRG